MEEIIDHLSREYPRLSPQLQRAALVILGNPGGVAINSMRTLAARAKVSPPTMLRLAQRLGFENYEAFRNVFKEIVAGSSYGIRADGLRKATDKQGIAGLVEATVEAAATGFERFRDPMFALSLERIADIMVGANRTFVVASGSSFGQAVSFQYVCRMALPSVELADGLGISSMGEVAFAGVDDAVLAISTSPYANATVDATRFAKERGATVAVVTDNRASPLARIADAAILTDTHSPHYFPSTICLNITLEILSALIAVKCGNAGVAAISDYEAVLRANDYYWTDTP